jgi:hypothetical protein
VHSECAICEELDYHHLLFRWFLDLELMEPSFDQTTFSKKGLRPSTSVTSGVPTPRTRARPTLSRGSAKKVRGKEAHLAYMGHALMRTAMGYWSTSP